MNNQPEQGKSDPWIVSHTNESIKYFTTTGLVVVRRN